MKIIQKKGKLKLPKRSEDKYIVVTQKDDCHYTIERNGDITQYYSVDRVCNVCSKYNHDSVFIQCEPNPTKPQRIMLEALKKHLREVVFGYQNLEFAEC